MSTPAGWYDDGQGAQRWWDGAQWTDHVQPDANALVAASDPAALDAASAQAAATAGAPIAAGDPQAGAVPPGSLQDAGPHAHPQVGTVPPGYPPAEPPKKSKLWILWVVLGGVVLLLGILAAIVVPILIGLFTAVGGTSGGAQRGATDAVELYDDAWNDVDCDAYQRSTTEAYRQNIALTDCATFEAQAGAFAESSDDYEIEVIAVEVMAEGGETSAVVTTIESYEPLVDAEGAPLDDAEDVEDRYTYTVIEQDGVWLIDEVIPQ